MAVQRLSNYKHNQSNIEIDMREVTLMEITEKYTKALIGDEGMKQLKELRTQIPE